MKKIYFYGSYPPPYTLNNYLYLSSKTCPFSPQHNFLIYFLSHLNMLLPYVSENHYTYTLYQKIGIIQYSHCTEHEFVYITQKPIIPNPITLNPIAPKLSYFRFNGIQYDEPLCFDFQCIGVPLIKMKVSV